MAMEIPVLSEYFDDAIEVKDARLRDQCTMECEFCDCTRNIKLPGKSLVNELNINKIKEEQLGGDGDNNNDDDNGFLDIGRIRLNRTKQKEGLEGLKSLSADNGNGSNDSKIKPIFAGAAIFGLFAIFHECIKYATYSNRLQSVGAGLGIHLRAGKDLNR
jgi:hypothetical protein